MVAASDWCSTIDILSEVSKLGRLFDAEADPDPEELVLEELPEPAEEAALVTAEADPPESGEPPPPPPHAYRLQSKIVNVALLSITLFFSAS
tara:strand:+ start:365 stop:640 length:276 start_codon:yes stop_codon:yes gene_type:complete